MNYDFKIWLEEVHTSILESKTFEQIYKTNHVCDVHLKDEFKLCHFNNSPSRILYRWSVCFVTYESKNSWQYISIWLLFIFLLQVSPQAFTLNEEDYLIDESSEALTEEDPFRESYVEANNTLRESHIQQPHTLQNLQPAPTFDTEEVHKKITQTFDLLSSMLSKKREEDECDLYGKLLAKKIRRYREEDRYQLMFEIDQLIHSKPP